MVYLELLICYGNIVRKVHSFENFNQCENSLYCNKTELAMKIFKWANQVVKFNRFFWLTIIWTVTCSIVYWQLYRISCITLSKANTRTKAAAQSALKDNYLENFREFLKNIRLAAYFSITECWRSEAPLKLNTMEKLLVQKFSVFQSDLNSISEHLMSCEVSKFFRTIFLQNAIGKLFLWKSTRVLERIMLQ